MQSICRFYVAWEKMLMAVLMVLPVLSACGRPGHPASADVPVSIHAVNYSDEEFEYVLTDPLNESNRGGGEPIGRYAAGGTMCCYSLPKQWQPGLKVKLDYDLYFPNPTGGNVRSTKNTEVIDIPRYVKPEELWLVRDVQGGMSIILSNFQPDHPQWPGRMKGWPVPTLAYHQERADIYILDSKGTIRDLQELSRDMQRNPEETAKGIWELADKYRKDSLAGFSGYKDKRYQKFLIDDFNKSLAEERLNLEKLEANRP